MYLNENEIDRYQCQILLKEIGGAGQQKLAQARVLIIGMGGLGTVLAQYLAGAGIGCLGLVDDDVVSLSNLHRQLIYREQDIDQPKVAVAAAYLRQLNPHITITPHPLRATADTIDGLVRDYDLVADGCDNFATRLLVNDACFRQRKILVSGAVGQFDGQLATFKAWLKDADGGFLPCYRSLMPAAPEDEQNCATLGIVNALTGIIGSLQALEVIKELTGAGESLAGKLLLYDGLRAQARQVKLNWDPANPNNGRASAFFAEHN